MTVLCSSKTTVGPRHVALKSDRLPASLRLRIWASQHLFPGRNEMGFGRIVRLHFGKIIKFNARRNEIEAMEYVCANTSIPIPRLYKVYETPDGAVHIVMEEIPSDGSYAYMAPKQIQALGQELSGYINQLRSLEPPEEGFIGSVSRGALQDHRTGDVRFGPFHSVEDFHSYLRFGGPLDKWLYDPVVKKIHAPSRAYRVKFAHADLNPTNVQYRNGRITGIIDWECAGWYPEYWEYTKMWFDNRPPYAKFFKAVEGCPSIDKYPEELKAEQEI